MNSKHILSQISYYLSLLRIQVEQHNHLNLQDINIHSENFFRDLLNTAFGYKLENINITKKNTQAIDLGDRENRIAIQVTSSPDLSKIKHTHKGFVASELNKTYDRLIMLIVGKKIKYRDSSLGSDANFIMSLTDDVWDINDILHKLSNLPLAKIETCRDFLRTELKIAEPRISNEILTLIKLIEVLSNAEEASSADSKQQDPDPEKKIYKRFAEHASFLEEQFTELHEIYGRALSEVQKNSDLSHMRVRKLQAYLMNWSDRVLTEHGGNPKAALDALTDKILQMMGTSEAGFDESAIRYYLINQLIACNVFPNKEAPNV